MRLHVRLPLGSARGPAAPAGGADPVSAALRWPIGLRERFHRAVGQPAQDTRRHVRWHHRLLDRAFAFRLQCPALPSRAVCHSRAADAVPRRARPVRPPAAHPRGGGREARDRLTAALLGADQAPEMKATLEDLLLTRFVATRPEDFRVFLDRQRAAEAAGYPKLA